MTVEMIVVLGMHKSGTSFIASTLQNSGFSAGHDVPKDKIGYKNGKSESPALNSINDEILGSTGLYSLDILQKPSNSENIVVEKMSEFILKQRESSTVLKDPRLVLTYRNNWMDLLPLHKVIVVYRNPMAVIRHYYRVNPKFSTAIRALRAWHRYNKELLRIIQISKHPVLITSFETLLTDPGEFEKMQRFTGQALNIFLESSRIKPLRPMLVKLGSILGFVTYSNLKKHHEKQ